MSSTETPTALKGMAEVLENGNRDQQDIVEKCATLAMMLVRKNRDYGSSVFDPPALAPEVSIEEACRVRMSDKVKRLTNLLSQKGGPGGFAENEPVEDSFDDLVGYLILYLIIRDRNAS